LALQIFSVTIFFLWPTTYPRELFPLPATLDPYTYHVFHNLRDVDAASNCFPSLHVSSCYLSSFMYLDEQREKFPIFFAWATAIAMSTLTTKQHYISDVVAGFSSAVLMYVIFHRLARYRARPSIPLSSGYQIAKA
jgi:membrane-associated phospholipid phosphatase